MRAARSVVLSFLVAALLGGALLHLPVATTDRSPLGLLDCLFTATSAVCVTGLVVAETGTRFSFFGRSVILVLIQLGGLGIMTFSTVLLLAAGQRLSFRGRSIIHNTLSRAGDRSLGAFVRYVVAITLLIESAGALLVALLLAWRHGYSWSEAIGHGVFLAVSAFCNAGFALWPDSLGGFLGDPWLVLTAMALIVTGGLGFVVLVNLRTYLLGDELGERQRLTLHSRVVLVATAVLLLVGLAGLVVFEWHGGLRDLPPGERLLACAFQAVTPRTAGFTVIDLGRLTMPSIFLTMLMMMIGAAPGSTGGGLKVTTIAVLWLHVRAGYRGHRRHHLFNRTLPLETVNRAFVVVAAGGVLALATIFALLISNHDLQGVGRLLFLPQVFEAISALGTVGLSLDFTGHLSAAGKVVVTLAMFAGRVGPLTLALAVTRTLQPERFRLAEEDVMIG